MFQIISCRLFLAFVFASRPAARPPSTTKLEYSFLPNWMMTHFGGYHSTRIPFQSIIGLSNTSPTNLAVSTAQPQHYVSLNMIRRFSLENLMKSPSGVLGTIFLLVLSFNVSNHSRYATSWFIYFSDSTQL